MSILRRISIWAISFVLIGFIVLNVLAYFHAQTMLSFSDQGVTHLKPEQLTNIQKISALFTGVNTPRPSARSVPSDLGSTCVNLRIPNGELSSLGTWYCHNVNNKHLVILFHGYATDKSSLIAAARVLMQENYAVLLVDFRGSWESSESYTTIGYLEAHDVVSAIGYVKQHYQYEKIVLYGQSMGAAAILRAVHSLDVQVDAIILESVFDNLLSTVKNRFYLMHVPTFPAAYLLVFWGGLQFGFNGFSHNPVDYAQAVNVPILFFHGEDDVRAHLFEARNVYNAIPPSAVKTLRIFPDSVHESLLARFPKEWKETVLDFLDKYL